MIVHSDRGFHYSYCFYALFGTLFIDIIYNNYVIIELICLKNKNIPIYK